MKTNKNNWRSSKKRIEALKDLKPKEQTKSIEGILPRGNETEGIKDERSKIKRYENTTIRDNLFFDLSKQPFDFRTFKTIRSLGYDIYNKRANIDEADQEQSNLFDYFLTLIARLSHKQKKYKKRKNYVSDRVRSLYKGRKSMILRAGSFH